jgi:hypothetical protein
MADDSNRSARSAGGQRGNENARGARGNPTPRLTTSARDHRERELFYLTNKDRPGFAWRPLNGRFDLIRSDGVSIVSVNTLGGPVHSAWHPSRGPLGGAEIGKLGDLIARL